MENVVFLTEFVSLNYEHFLEECFACDYVRAARSGTLS